MGREIVYLDVLSIENLLVNFALLYSIKDYCTNNAKLLRLLCGAGMGVSYLIVLIMTDWDWLASPITRILVSVIVLAIAFSIRSIKQMIKALILFYLVSFILAGIIIGECYLLNEKFSVSNNVFILERVNIVHLSIGAILCIFVVKLSFNFFMNFSSHRDNKVEITIFNANKSITLKGLVDTGNTLRDPVTNQTAIVVFYKDISYILPREIVEALENMKNINIYDSFQELSSTFKFKLKILSYRAVGVENGKLLAYKVERVEAHWCDRKTNRDKMYRDNALIALCDAPITYNGEYEAIVSPDLLYGG